MIPTVHVPILAAEIVENLLPPFQLRAGTHVDCTLGGGGHLAAMMTALEGTPFGGQHRFIAVDQDPAAIERARERFPKELESGRLVLQRGRFSELRIPAEFPPVLGVLADLGFSSDQMDSPERGLGFRRSGPVDMRLDPERGEPAFRLLERLSERELADLFFEFGEERLSRRIARRIVEARQAGQLPDTTVGLAELVARVFPPSQRHGRIHPATRTFQALRIAVNQELDELDALLGRVLPLILSVGGRSAFLSFHSLEDRRVKKAFQKPGGGWCPVFKKPIEAGEAEVLENPRARSAKLRVAEWVGEGGAV